MKKTSVLPILTAALALSISFNSWATPTYIAGVGDPTPTSSDFNGLPSDYLEVALVGNLINGNGLFGNANINSRIGYGTTGANNPTNPMLNLAKEINYSVDDRFSFTEATNVLLSLIVKEGHPEPEGSSHLLARNQNQIEDFNVFAVEFNTNQEVMLAEYKDAGNLTTGNEDDAYYLASGFQATLDPGDWYLSFRIVGPNDNSVEFLAQVSAQQKQPPQGVPEPGMLALFALGALSLIFTRRRKITTKC